ncbi:MAG TPA: hypothetical protein VM534_11495, partial [Thermoanaerobaculia bacterium]|nr:hypothetical protein [Thermoanaerobaculia bacterium]
ILEPQAVWEAVRGATGLTDDHVDAVAIYQSFLTDIMLYASAYSTVGNPAVDGVAGRTGYGSAHPRAPALLHMNRIDFSLNLDLADATHVLSHELGHRWLYFIDIDNPGGSADVLRGGGAHPAQYVHTPAAFDVYSDRDSSTMGGAWFEDNGDGTFTAPDPVGYYGYSWHELYLMGLAAPGEVEPWYWIQDSDPPLGNAYWPPAGITVAGTRRNVTIQDVIRRMQPRFPAYPETQKRFKVLFVVLHRPGAPPSGDQIDLAEQRRRELQSVFLRMTGGRGSLDTRVTPPPRLRGIRR